MYDCSHIFTPFFQSHEINCPFDIFLGIFIKQNIFWLVESLNARIFKKFYDLRENKNWEKYMFKYSILSLCKDYFRITFCSDLMRNRDING